MSYVASYEIQRILAVWTSVFLQYKLRHFTYCVV